MTEVEKATGQRNEIVLCSMRLGCVCEAAELALVSSAQNAEKMLALGTGLIDKATSACGWQLARKTPGRGL